MRLTDGTFLGPYQIRSRIGAGGMGEVYRAHDTRVRRDVAIKVSAEKFTNRFEREARAVAALNHPNICQLYDVGPDYLVMELVEGSSPKGPLPLDEALRIACQIADALEAAHEKGIVHRDLKPENLKIRLDGTVKVLDFGLAKMSSPDDNEQECVRTSSMSLTEVGSVMGSAPYMSPEQAQGKPADKRTDIWAFGVVLYELLTGKRPFTGETAQGTLAMVLTKEPDWARVPANVRPLLRRCLEKDPRRRLRDIGDAIALVNDEVSPEGGNRRLLPWAAGVLLAVGAASWFAGRAARSTDSNQLIRLDAELGSNAVAGPGITIALSPDGRRIVYPVRTAGTQQMLVTRALDQARVTPLLGTDGATDPFFSTDSKWVGFAAGGKLRKISVEGGAPVSLCDLLFFRGGSWAEDGSIVAALSSARGLSRIPEAGGEPQRLTKLRQGESNHRWPQVLPGGKKVLFTAATNLGGATLHLLSLETGQIQDLQIRGSFGRYVPTSGTSGHLLYLVEDALFGVAMDPDTGAIRGAPSPLVENVAYSMLTGGGQFDVSRTGTLAYLRGETAELWTAAWLDATGKITPLLSKPGTYFTPRVSPDGNLLAFAAASRKGSDIYVYDWRSDAMTRLTFNEQANSTPVWAPDGKHIAYRAATSTGATIKWVRADGAGETVQLLENAAMLDVYAFTPDGKRLAYTELNSETGGDAWTLPIDTGDPERPRATKPELFFRTHASDQVHGFSPNGRWVAYMSNESGRAEVYVRSFPGPSGMWQISRDGGSLPRWSRNGRELFFEAPDRRIMVAEYVGQGESFAVVGKPRVWADTRPYGPAGIDLSPDGKRFVIFVQSDSAKENLQATFLMNFFTELRQKLPARRK